MRGWLRGLWARWLEPEDPEARRGRARLAALGSATLIVLVTLPLLALYIGALVGLFSWAFGAMP